MPHPIKSRYTIPYGAQFGAPRAGGRRHQGTDYHAPIGTPIYATGNGRVVSNIGETGVGIGFGNYISLAYPGNRVTLDGHLRERSRLAVGTLVTSNTIVAYIGMSGNAIYADPPGAHDHHQIWINGVLVDPQSFYGVDVADSGSTLIPVTQSGVDPMSFSIVPNPGGNISVQSLITGNFVSIGSTYHVSLLQRVKKNDNNDAMVPAEQDIVRAYLNTINPPVPAPVIPPVSLTPAQITAIGAAVVVPAPPHEFIITGKASA